MTKRRQRKAQAKRIRAVVEQALARGTEADLDEIAFFEGQSATYGIPHPIVTEIGVSRRFALDGFLGEEDPN